jgi:hypothetical protein
MILGFAIVDITEFISIGYKAARCLSSVSEKQLGIPPT